MVSVTCADILQLLKKHGALSTKEIADYIHCPTKMVWPRLARLSVLWIKKSYKTEGKRKIAYWSLTERAKMELEDGGYDSFYQMPWAKKIEERMNAKGLEYRRF